MHHHPSLSPRLRAFQSRYATVRNFKREKNKPKEKVVVSNGRCVFVCACEWGGGKTVAKQKELKCFVCDVCSVFCCCCCCCPHLQSPIISEFFRIRLPRQFVFFYALLECLNLWKTMLVTRRIAWDRMTKKATTNQQSTTTQTLVCQLYHLRKNSPYTFSTLLFRMMSFMWR